MVTKRFLVLIALFYVTSCFSVSGGQTTTVVVEKGQKKLSITNVEPGIYTLQKLFDAADDVFIVEVVAGDTETYESAVYKAKVLTRFKGGGKDEVIYFGPYDTRLGGKYLLFLRTDKVISPLHEENPGFGPVSYAKVFDEGYSSMEISYECVFQGSEHCGYGIRVCTDYIKLPESIEISPEAEGYTPFWMSMG
jgi:hypothetical protein